MLKGCQRKIIMVKDTESAYFDAAYFVLRSDLPPSAKEGDILTEANRMIAACQRGSEVPRAASDKPRLSRLTVASMVITVLSLAAALLAILT